MAECTKLHITDILSKVMTANGGKTYLGLAIMAAGYFLQFYGSDYETGMKLVDGGQTLAGVGIAHKMQKLINAISSVQKGSDAS
jgi:hypothetical protein